MISRSDLSSFTQQGAQTSAQVTYTAVKAALAKSRAVQAYDPDIFLQGSYANHTNTRGDSDVDIVVMMRSSFMPDLSRLSVAERANYEATTSPATTYVDGLREAVTQALNAYFGERRVRPRDKCIRVDKSDGYVDADVVPAQQHRIYQSYPVYGEPRFTEGISIRPASLGIRIVNFPKEHRKNGEAKNGRCNDLYKPTVRQVKRLRRLAVDRGLVGKKDAPGYLLECLVYNVPDSLFAFDDRLRAIQVLDWLQSQSAEQLASDMKSCDEIHTLFRTDPGDHNQYTAKRTSATLLDLL